MHVNVKHILIGLIMQSLMQNKKKKLKTPEEFSSDVNMSETCINYSQLKKKYSGGNTES